MREIRTSGSVGAAGGNSRGDPTAGGFSCPRLLLGGRHGRRSGSLRLERLCPAGVHLPGALDGAQDQIRLVRLKHQLQLDHPARQQPLAYRTLLRRRCAFGVQHPSIASAQPLVMYVKDNEEMAAVNE